MNEVCEMNITRIHYKYVKKYKRLPFKLSHLDMQSPALPDFIMKFTLNFFFNSENQSDPNYSSSRKQAFFKTKIQKNS